MADLYQTEATRTLRAAGYWAEKFVDMRFKNQKGETVSELQGSVREYPLSGRPDMYYIMPSVGGISPGGFVEVKTGQGKNRQRFAYAQWDEGKRRWYDKYARKAGIHVWIFLVLGGRINGQQYPRVAYLFPIQVFENLEATDTRKSLSYQRATECLTSFRLEWAGNNTWDIPTDHPFKTQEGRRTNDNPTLINSVL